MTARMGYSRKNPKRGSAEDMEFPGVLKKKKEKEKDMEIAGTNKKDGQFPGVIKKIVEFLWGLGHCHWCFEISVPMGVTQFCRISRGEVASGLSKG